MSTGPGLQDQVPVDDLAVDISVLVFPDEADTLGNDAAYRLGMVLPKKQARRSVTRSLIRHQVRDALRRHAPSVLAKLGHRQDIDGWVVRLRAPFDKQQFPSAASDALKALVRQELDALWQGLKLPADKRPSGSSAPVYKAPAAPDPGGAA